MKIRHKEHGEVDGIRECSRTYGGHGVVKFWEKDGRRFYAEDGWEAVPETRLVDVTGDDREVEVNLRLLTVRPPGVSYSNTYRLMVPYFFKKVDRYDLPDDFIQKLNNSLHDAFDKRHTYPSLSTMNWLQQFKKPCLIIQKEEPAS